MKQKMKTGMISNATEFNNNDDLTIYFEEFKRKMSLKNKKVTALYHKKEGLIFCHIKVKKYTLTLETYKSTEGQKNEKDAKISAIQALKKAKSEIKIPKTSKGEKGTIKTFLNRLKKVA